MSKRYIPNEQHEKKLIESSQKSSLLPLQMAIKYTKNLDCTCEDGNTALIHAVKYENLEGVKLLIQAGVNVNFLGEDGVTALMWAGECECSDIAKELIHAGADVNIKDKDGNTALMWAVGSSSDTFRVAAMLIEAGSTFEGTDDLEQNQDFYAPKSAELIKAAKQQNKYYKKNIKSLKGAGTQSRPQRRPRYK